MPAKYYSITLTSNFGRTFTWSGYFNSQWDAVQDAIANAPACQPGEYWSA